MQGKIEKLVDCPVVGRRVRIMEIHDTCQPTISCCLSSRVVMSQCEEEGKCRQEDRTICCPLWQEADACTNPQPEKIQGE